MSLAVHSSRIGRVGPLRDAGCRRKKRRSDRRGGRFLRRGSASIDYVLLLGAMMTLGGLALYSGSKIIVLVYDMVCAFVAWPFL